MAADDIVATLGLADPEGPVRPRARYAVDLSPEAAARRKAEAKTAKHQPRRPRSQRPAADPVPATMPSEDAVALAFVERFGDKFRYVAPLHRWMGWDGMRWAEDSTHVVFDIARRLVRELVEGGKAERSTACAAFIAGVERLLRHDQALAVLPEDFDADPWLLNTKSGVFDLTTSQCRPHDPLLMCSKITGAGIDGAAAGMPLWQKFLADITLGDRELLLYLQRVAGYCATGVTTEDILPFLFGIGANGKSSFAEAIEHALGDYAKTFAPDVLMEAKGERHPTELAQFQGVRFALTSEPASSASWNDSRIKSMTGDATISARVMRGDPYTFKRTHKTMVLGNHMPRLADVSHAIRRRVQMVPFRAVFEHQAGVGTSMRERLKAECADAILAWIIDGAKWWQAHGTLPPVAVRELTDEYLSEQDVFGQWVTECCQREERVSERSSLLHRSYSQWCERQGLRPESVVRFSAHLVSAGFQKKATAVGKLFYGLRLRTPE